MRMSGPMNAITNLLQSFCLAGLIFCTVPAPAVGAAELKAELVNKVIEDWGGEGYPTGEVMLTFPDGRILVLPYRSHLQPVVADGQVYIFVTEAGELKSIVIYDPAKGQGQSFFPLPDDLDPYFGSPSFSPDGTRVAYYCPLGARQESGFIDRTGKIVIPLQSHWFAAGKFSEGLAKVAVKWKYGFIDTTGRLVIIPQYDTTGDFSEGLAMVAVGDNFGFIDRTGKIVIELTYESAFNFVEGLAWVKRGEWQGFIDRQGKDVIWKHHALIQRFSEGLVAAKFVRKWGFLDKSGEVAITPQFDLAQTFSEGLAMVMKDNKCGFIDHTGEIAIPLKYDNANAFSEGLAAVGIGKKYGFIDKTGKLVIPAKFDNAHVFQEGVAFVTLDGKKGLIDKTGRVIIPWPYKDQFPSFSAGLARVRVDGKWGFIDTAGKMVIPPRFDYADNFSEGLAGIRVGEREGFGVRVRSWPDWQLLWESPSYKGLDITHPLMPPVWKTSSLVEVDSIFSYPQRPLTFQVPGPRKNEKAKTE
jgi:WG containing repeat